MYGHHHSQHHQINVQHQHNIHHHLQQQHQQIAANVHSTSTSAAPSSSSTSSSANDYHLQQQRQYHHSHHSQQPIHYNQQQHFSQTGSQQSVPVQVSAMPPHQEAAANINQYNYDLGTTAKQIFDAHSRTFLSYFDFNEMSRIANQHPIMMDSSGLLQHSIHGLSSPSSSSSSSSSSSLGSSNEIQRILSLVNFNKKIELIIFFYNYKILDPLFLVKTTIIHRISRESN